MSVADRQRNHLDPTTWTVARQHELSWYDPKWNESGIYGIIDKDTGRMYVGSAVNILHRWHDHQSRLCKRKHGNRFLARVFEKRPEALEFVLIESVADKQKLIEREQFWMCFYGSVQPHGMNLAKRAGSMLGFKHTAEAKRKMGAWQKGVSKLTPEHKAKMWAGVLARLERDPDFKDAYGKGRKGKTNTPDHNRQTRESKRIAGLQDRPVIAFDKLGQFVKGYRDAQEASIENGVLKSSILATIYRSVAARTCAGYSWKFL